MAGSRLQRGVRRPSSRARAEGQYLVNRAAVRRTDLVELLADVGLDPMHSIVGQGKVEQVLALEARGQARVGRGGGRAREVQAAPASR